MLISIAVLMIIITGLAVWFFFLRENPQKKEGIEDFAFIHGKLLGIYSNQVVYLKRDEKDGRFSDVMIMKANGEDSVKFIESQVRIDVQSCTLNGSKLMYIKSLPFYNEIWIYDLETQTNKRHFIGTMVTLKDVLWEKEALYVRSGDVRGRMKEQTEWSYLYKVDLDTGINYVMASNCSVLIGKDQDVIRYGTYISDRKETEIKELSLTADAKTTPLVLATLKGRIQKADVIQSMCFVLNDKAELFLGEDLNAIESIAENINDVVFVDQEVWYSNADGLYILKDMASKESQRFEKGHIKSFLVKGTYLYYEKKGIGLYRKSIENGGLVKIVGRNDFIVNDYDAEGNWVSYFDEKDQSHRLFPIFEQKKKTFDEKLTFCIKNNIIVGYPNGAFGLEDALTDNEMFQIFEQSLNMKNEKNDENKAFIQGLKKKYQMGTWDKETSRSAFAQMLYEVLEYEHYFLLKTEKDWDVVLKDNGILDVDFFNNPSPLTRNQAIEIVYDKILYVFD